MQRPQPSEYKPYFQRYIDLVPPGSFADLFTANTQLVTDFFAAIPPARHGYRYAAGKWTVTDIVQHINDTERVLAYRALVAARGDSHTPLHVMDEDLYAAHAGGTERDMDDLLAEFGAIRQSSFYLFRGLSETLSLQRGNAIDHTVTPRALAWIIMGHPLHHMGVIRERYL